MHPAVWLSHTHTHAHTTATENEYEHVNYKKLLIELECAHP